MQFFNDNANSEGDLLLRAITLDLERFIEIGIDATVIIPNFEEITGMSTWPDWDIITEEANLYLTKVGEDRSFEVVQSTFVSRYHIKRGESRRGPFLWDYGFYDLSCSFCSLPAESFFYDVEREEYYCPVCEQEE